MKAEWSILCPVYIFYIWYYTKFTLSTKSEEGDSSIVSESNTSNKQPVLLPEFKRRKRHRRKNIENQEQCIMRGVYYKNMKWQAAIKVGNKQIHLGTVGSQEEVAHLYDRAAYLCGREPNFDLTIEEKEELSKLSWDDFLIMTRSAINSKKSQRRVGSRMKFESFHPNYSGSEMEAVAEADQGRNGFSGSDGADISAVAVADQRRNRFSGSDGADISAVAVAETDDQLAFSGSYWLLGFYMIKGEIASRVLIGYYTPEPSRFQAGTLFS